MCLTATTVTPWRLRMPVSPSGLPITSEGGCRLDQSEVVLWRDWQRAEQEAGGVESEDWVFTNTDGKPVHPHSISQSFERIATRAGVPRIRLHDIRQTHGTLLIKAGVPVKVVSERLGHGNCALTIDTYQHVLPGMQAEAARTFEKAHQSANRCPSLSTSSSFPGLLISQTDSLPDGSPPIVKVEQQDVLAGGQVLAVSSDGRIPCGRIAGLLVR